MILLVYKPVDVDATMEICTGTDWVEFPSKRQKYCKIHEIEFDMDQFCPFFKKTTPPPFVSCGKQKKDFPGVSMGGVTNELTMSGLTALQTRALFLRNGGYSFGRLGKELGMSKQSAERLVKKALRNTGGGGDDSKGGGVTGGDSRLVERKAVAVESRSQKALNVRLHNDQFSFKGKFDYVSLGGLVKMLGKNLEYRVLSGPGWYLQAFRNGSMTVRFPGDIDGRDERECKMKADSRALAFFDGFPIPGVSIIDKGRVVNRHYGLLGTSFARMVHEKKELVIVRDSDGKVRIRIDFSGEKPEIDAEHVQKGFADMGATREYMEDIINKTHFLPSEVVQRIGDMTSLVGGVTKNQMVFAENQLSHISSIKELAARVNEWVVAGRELVATVNELKTVVSLKKDVLPLDRLFADPVLLEKFNKASKEEKDKLLGL